MQRPLSLAFGMTGLTFALVANGCALLGLYDPPSGPGAPDPAKTVAVAGSLCGAISLLFHATYLVWGYPLGTDWLSIRIQMLFSSVAGMYGFQLLGLTIIQLNGYDLKVFGDICLFDALLGLMQMVVFARYAREAGLSGAHTFWVQYTLAAWVCLSFGVWGTTHGHIPAKVTGVIAFAGVVGTLYFLFYLGGLLEPPGTPKSKPASTEELEAQTVGN
jgi:hypothetical protein